MTALMPMLDAPVTNAISPEHVRHEAALALSPHIDFHGAWSDAERDQWAERRTFAPTHVAVCDVVWTARQAEIDDLREQLRHARWCNESAVSLLATADPARLCGSGRIGVMLGNLRRLLESSLGGKP